jgi:hypothetical protein
MKQGDRTEAFNLENQKQYVHQRVITFSWTTAPSRYRQASKRFTLRGYQHQVGTDKHRIASLFVVISTFGLFPQGFKKVEPKVVQI